MEQAPITVSENDYERIDSLLDKTGDNATGIRELQDELARANIVASDQMPPEVATMNSTVHFENVETGKRFELALVYPHEIDGSPGKISILAPAGSALLGLAVEQIIHWQGPGDNPLKLRVLEVHDQPESRDR